MDSWALIIATLIGVVLTWVGSIVMAHFKDVKNVGDGAQSEIQKLTNDFMAFQVKVANDYARRDELNKTEMTIMGVLQRLESKLDIVQKELYDRGPQ